MRTAKAIVGGPLARGLVVVALLVGLGACAGSGQPSGAGAEGAAAEDVDERSRTAAILKRLKGPNTNRGGRGR